MFTPFAFVKSAPAGGVIDPDAQAFINATGISGSNATAINQLVLDLKGFGIYDLFYAIYPFVGGTADTHKYNLINPADTNGAYRLTFAGGWTHDSNGITGNGTNTEADTHFLPSSSFITDDAHFSIYSRTSGVSKCDFGVRTETPSTAINQLFILLDNGGALNFGTDFPGFADTGNALGLYVGNREPGTDKTQFFKNTSRLINYSQTMTKPNLTLTIGNSNGGSEFSNRNYAFASIGAGFDLTTEADFYTAVQAYQTALGRQV